MGLHAPSIHFHLGAWAVSVACVFLAVALALALKYHEIIHKLFRINLKKNNREETLNVYVDKLDFAAHVSGIIGFLGIVVSGFAGILDASGMETLESISIDGFLTGLDISTQTESLTFKVVWTIIGAFCFVFMGIIRMYVVNYRHERMYNQRVSLLLLYIISITNGFFIMVVVAGTGGAIIYGESLLNLHPILEGFLPGGIYLPVLAVVESAVAFVLILWMWIRPMKHGNLAVSTA
ncbi:MAG: hypothetical protein ACFFD4_10165 [Candidatus Odinarchaeota archaeon]